MSDSTTPDKPAAAEPVAEPASKPPVKPVAKKASATRKKVVKRKPTQANEVKQAKQSDYDAGFSLGARVWPD